MFVLLSGSFWTSFILRQKSCFHLACTGATTGAMGTLLGAMGAVGATGGVGASGVVGATGVVGAVVGETLGFGDGIAGALQR